MDRTVAENLKEMKNCLLRMREQLALQSPDFEQMEPASRRTCHIGSIISSIALLSAH